MEQWKVRFHIFFFDRVHFNRPRDGENEVLVFTNDISTPDRIMNFRKCRRNSRRKIRRNYGVNCPFEMYKLFGRMTVNFVVVFIVNFQIILEPGMLVLLIQSPKNLFPLKK